MEQSKKKLKQPWYELESNRDFILNSSREAPRAFLYNLWTPKVLVGKAAIGFMALHLLEEFAEDQRRVLIIVDPFLEKYADRVVGSLKARGFTCEIWKGVEPEVPIETVREGVKTCDAFKPTILITIGGGSAIDTAKAVFLLYEKPDVDFYNLIPLNAIGLRKKIKKFIAIPTTSGTGSEATLGSMVMDTTQNPPKKINISIMEMLPDLAILSTEFVKSMPAHLTAGTGIDALAHALSAYFCSCHNVFSDIFSLEAIELILDYLPRAYKRGNDLEARERMQIAAFLAGLAISNSGIAMDHSLGHSFGGTFHVHHGVCVGLFVPYAIQFVSKNTDRYIKVAELFGVKTQGKSNEKILEDLIQTYKNFLRALDLPTSIKEIDKPRITRQELDENLDLLAKNAFDDICTLDNFRMPTEKDFQKIFSYAYEGKDIDF